MSDNRASFSLSASERSAHPEDGDAFSLSSSISLRSLHSGNNARSKAAAAIAAAASPLASSTSKAADSSLIFERLVQDPLTDAQPIPHSLPRHISSETFIPASLDTATHMIKNNDFSSLGLGDGADNSNSPFEESEFGLNLSRRSSLANLEAALGGPSSRRPSTSNFQSSSYRLNSISSNTLFRSNTNSSFSNLTQQFQNESQSRGQNSQGLVGPLDTSEDPSSIPAPHPLSQSSSQNSNLPMLFKTSTSGSYSQRGQTTGSPMLRNKSFCSYADIIAQDDHESSFSIRRPSISMSLSSQKLMRTNSISSSNNGANSPRSPSISSAFPNNFRNNTTCTPTPPTTAGTNSLSASMSSNRNNNRNGSPNLNYMISPSVPQYAIDDTDNDTIFSFQSSSNPSATPRKSFSQQQNQGFSGRSLNAYSSRVSNNNSSHIDSLIRNTAALSGNQNNTPSSSTSPNGRQNSHKITACAAKSVNGNANNNNNKSAVKNAVPQNELKKQDLSPQCSKPSDEESVKSFKTASFSAE